MSRSPRKGKKGGRTRVLRVVLDTNCLVSALLFKNGRLAELRAAWQAGRFAPLACKETITELVRVLGYPKFRLDKDDVEALLGDALPWMETCGVTQPEAPVQALRDPSDAAFVHLARQSGADLLVSGDEHLLLLKDALADIRVLSPGEFLELLHAPDQTETRREAEPDMLRTVAIRKREVNAGRAIGFDGGMGGIDDLIK